MIVGTTPAISAMPTAAAPAAPPVAATPVDPGQDARQPDTTATADARRGATLAEGAAPTLAELTEHAQRPGSSLPQLAPTGGNTVDLLVDEGQALPPLLDAINGAKRTIDFAMFSLIDDGGGTQVVDALADRARAGIDVRVAVDQVGSLLLPVGKQARMLDRLRESGAQVLVNKRISTSGMQPVDHRKLLVVDGETAFTGGMNLSERYADWHDVLARVQGPAAAQLGAQFLDRWVDLAGPTAVQRRNLTGGDESGPLPAATAGADGARTGVSMLVNHPEAELNASTSLIRNIGEAKDRAWIMTPTLTNPEVVEALKGAAARGVDTRIAVGPNGPPGIKALGMIGSTFYRELLGAGVQVFEHPDVSHAKASLVDDVASIGSLNMTRRAMVWDHELMIAGNDAPFVKQVEGLFATDFGRSTQVAADRAESRGVRIADRIRRMTGLKW